MWTQKGRNLAITPLTCYFSVSGGGLEPLYRPSSQRATLGNFGKVRDSVGWFGPRIAAFVDRVHSRNPLLGSDAEQVRQCPRVPLDHLPAVRHELAGERPRQGMTPH